MSNPYPGSSEKFYNALQNLKNYDYSMGHDTTLDLVMEQAIDKSSFREVEFEVFYLTEKVSDSAKKEFGEILMEMKF